jgi:hypothetical protein
VAVFLAAGDVVDCATQQGLFVEVPVYKAVSWEQGLLE